MLCLESMAGLTVPVVQPNYHYHHRPCFLLRLHLPLLVEAHPALRSRYGIRPLQAPHVYDSLPFRRLPLPRPASRRGRVGRHRHDKFHGMGWRPHHDCRLGAAGRKFVCILNLVCAFCLALEERWHSESRWMGGTHGANFERFHSRYVLSCTFSPFRR